MDLERLLILDGGKVFVRSGSLHVHKPNGTEKSCPLVDIAGLMFEGFAFDISSGVFQAACEYGFSVVFCNKDFSPACSLMYPVSHVNHMELLEAQFKCDHKDVFRKLIERKILNQAALIRRILADQQPGPVLYLERIANELTVERVFLQEASAAKHYWKFVFDSQLSRVTRGATDPVNSRLNFGYAIVRSYLARYFHLAGIHIGVGVGHKNAKNPFCLVDDFIEPYRPIVDAFVLTLNLQGEFGSPHSKQEILKLLNEEVLIAGKKYALTRACRQTVLSFSNYLKGASNQIDLPSHSFV